MIGACISTSNLPSIPNAYLVILSNIMIFPGTGGSGIKKHGNDQQKAGNAIVYGISNLLIYTSHERLSKILSFISPK